MNTQVSIIDFGSQFTQLIARKMREYGCYAKIFSPEEFRFSDKIKGIVLSGSYRSIEDYVNYERLISDVLSANRDNNVPILGICYGKQLLSHFLGGDVSSGNSREYGKAVLSIQNRDTPIVQGIMEDAFPVWMSHGDTVSKIPSGFECIASTEDCPFAIIADDKRKIYAFQFHPEVSHTKNGDVLLQNFINIAGLQNSWNLEVFSEEEKNHVVDTVGNSSVIAAVSGGVDSTVAAAFMHNAIGERLHCIFVNTGLLRKNEVVEVQDSFRGLGIPLQVVDASDEFFEKLSGVSEPESKRKVIGETFIKVFERKAAEIPNAEFLLQGTLYPDIVESGAYGSDKIKSHHNVGGLPQKMGLKLIEPFKLLFKDEVRKIGKKIGISDSLLFRHPSPGPGLAIRILGEVTREKVRILQDVDEIYIATMKKCNLYSEIWQAFAVLLPVCSVGVMGDKRSYNYVCAVRAVSSTDGMTASAYPFEASDSSSLRFLAFLNEIATKITNQVREVSRVVYDITSKPPATIEWE